MALNTVKNAAYTRQNGIRRRRIQGRSCFQHKQPSTEAMLASPSSLRYSEIQMTSNVRQNLLGLSNHETLRWGRGERAKDVQSSFASSQWYRPIQMWPVCISQCVVDFLINSISTVVCEYRIEDHKHWSLDSCTGKSDVCRCMLAVQ